MSPSLKDINSTILAQGKPAVNPDIPDLPLTDNKPVGGVKSGEPFLSRKGNRPVKSVNFWYTEDRLTAIEISWYFDESTEVYGDISKGTKSKLLKLGPYEIVEHTSVWKTEEGNGIAYIELQTNGVQFFSAGTKPSEGDPVKENVGNGHLLAFAGTTRGELGSLSFLYMSSEVKMTQMFGNIVFDKPPTVGDIRSAVALEQEFKNYTDGDTPWSFSRTKDYTSTQNWGKSRTEDFGAEASISGGFLGIEVGASTSWSISDTEEHGRSWSDSETFSWSLSGTLKPGTGVRVSAYAIEGNCTLSFSWAEWMQICLPRPPNPPHCYWDWFFPANGGHYKGGLFSKGSVEARNIPI